MSRELNPKPRELDAQSSWISCRYRCCECSRNRLWDHINHKKLNRSEGLGPRSFLTPH